MAIRVPLVQINGRLVELQAGDKFHTKIVEPYIHDQTIPSSVWEINHNLDKYPSVSVILNDGTEVFGLKVYNSKNKITLSFSKPIIGKAILS